MTDHIIRGVGFEFRTEMPEPHMAVPDRMGDLAKRVEELERTVADLTRHNQELRETVRALLNPLPP